MEERGNMKYQTQTKEGAAAIYTVVFFCLLIGIVTIGFVSIMMQDIISSTNYDLSQSAYDAALAGVEDAKVLLLKYNTCMSNEERLSGGKCQSIIDKINTAGSSDDCDLVGSNNGRQSGEHETLIQSQNTGGRNDSRALAESIDMAYTCVKLSLASDDYLGTLTETSDVKIIPLRTGVGSAYNDAGSNGEFNRIRIEWYSEEDNRTVRDLANYTSVYNSMTDSRTFTTSKTAMGGTEDKWRNFGQSATIAPPIRVGIIQTDETFRYYDFDTPNVYGDEVYTDRGTLVLRPIKGGDTLPENHITSNTSNGFGGSVMSSFSDYTSGRNAINSPYDVWCHDSTQMADKGDLYSCRAEIDVPHTKFGTTNNATRFLTLSSFYGKPDTSFRIQLLQCDDSGCKVVKFVGVQSMVDATGRANDLFRRVEARIELQDVSYPFVKYGLSVYGSGTGEGEIFKNYWATSNCWYKDKGVAHSCADYYKPSPNSNGNF